jgi:hypothetical protein
MDDLARFGCLDPKCRLYGQRDAGNLYVRDYHGSGRLAAVMLPRVR